MPTVSKKQEKFMQAVAHNPKFAKAAGVPQSVGKEFTKSGGSMKKTVKKMAMGGMGGMGGMGKAIGAKAPPKGSSVPAFAKSSLENMMKRAPARDPGLGNSPFGPRSGPKSSAGSVAQAGKPRTPRDIGDGRPPAMGPKSGMGPKPGVGMAAKKPAGRMMASGGLAAGHKAADGIAKKGKTKAKMVTMGGSTGMKRGGKVC